MSFEEKVKKGKKIRNMSLEELKKKKQDLENNKSTTSQYYMHVCKRLNDLVATQPKKETVFPKETVTGPSVCDKDLPKPA